MGRAADILGVRQAFLRSLDAAELLIPQRSDAGTPLNSACRIIILEDQLAEARRINAELRDTQQRDSEPSAAPE